jgi:Icc-related predicted phosphoesterase
LKFVAIADSHGLHTDLILPPGDILIHAGDVSMKGEHCEIVGFLKWFDSLDYKYKIVIAGNHDFYFERESHEEIESVIPNGVIYLKDSGITVDGIRVWGSPITPWFFNWAFNRYRGDPIRRHWDLIPSNIDLLITHGPVFRRLDKNKKGEHVGCKDLFQKVHEIRPKVHVCGHVHESYGIIEKDGIKFINCSLLNENFELVNDPIEFEL